MYSVVACIVIYKNSFEEIKDLISEFYKENINQKLVIVDNSNIEKLEDKVKSIDTSIDFIISKNIGYGRGNNIAIQKYKGKSNFFLIMNPDVFLKFENLKKILNYAESKKRFGLIVPKIVSEKSELQYLCKLLPTPKELIVRRFFSVFSSNKDYELRFIDYSKEFKVPVVSGCFILCNYFNLLKEKGFDERFFMYLEDVDLSRRMYKYGNYYYPDVVIIHKHKRASYKNIKMTLVHISSAVKYFNKWGWFSDKIRKQVNNQIKKGKINI